MAFSKDFADAVEQGNLLRVKLMLKNSLLIDPSCQNFNQMLAFAKEKIPNLIDGHDGEILKNDREWSEEYYNEQTVKIVNNFSQERIDLLKGMAQKLYTQSGEETGRSGYTDRSVKEIRNDAAEAGSGVTIQKIIGTAIVVMGACLVISWGGGRLFGVGIPFWTLVIGILAIAGGIVVIFLDKK